MDPFLDMVLIRGFIITVGSDDQEILERGSGEDTLPEKKKSPADPLYIVEEKDDGMLLLAQCMQEPNHHLMKS